MLPSWGQSLVGFQLEARIDSSLERGDFRLAERLIEKARRESGDQDLLSWQRAELYVLKSRYEHAIREYASYLQADPDRYAVVEARLSQFLQRPGAAVRIITALAETAATADDGLQLSLLASTCALAAGKPEQGLEVLKPYVDDPKVSIVVLQYGHEAEAKGHFQVAVAAYRQYAEHNRDSPQYYTALVRQAEVASNLGEYERAVDLYSGIAQEFPDRLETLEAILVLAELYLEELHQPDTAHSLLSQVLDNARPIDMRLRAISLAAECNVRMNDLDQAHATIEAANIFPVPYELRWRRAEIRFLEMKFGSAADSLEKLLHEDLKLELANDALQLLLLIEDHQTSPKALEVLARAQLLERQQCIDEAADEWLWLQRDGPMKLRPLSLLLHANHRIEDGDDITAVALLQRLVDSRRDSPYAIDAYVQLAGIYLRDGQSLRALKTFESAVLAFPHDGRTPEIRLQIERLRTAQERSPG